MLHLIKLAVGVADPETLAARQLQRARETGAHGGRPFLRTRNFPRRADEILDGGSVFWVMSGVLLCRQRVVEILPDFRDDGTPCTAVVLQKPAIAVMPRMIRPFQGWRYLIPADAPDDLAATGAAGGDELPPVLRRELAALCLL
jgi:hypothetical protein